MLIKYGGIMALLHSENIPLGTKAGDFTLPGINEKLWSLSDFDDSELLVIMFICNHCPYVKAVQKRLVELQSEYDPLKVRLVAINSNDYDTYPEDNLEGMQYTANELDYNFPYLLDDFQEVAKDYHAVCTPDFYLYNKDRKLVYHGRLDDNWQEPEKVKRRELKRAIDTTLKNKRIRFKQLSSMGCSIKWRT